jgi:glycogen synthase
LLETTKASLIQNPIEGVTVLGFIDDTEKSKRIASSKWIVVPPTTAEDLGLVPIEGRKTCVPSIITPVGGLSEAAGPAAIVCSNSDARALQKSLEEASEMIESDYTNRCHLAYKSLEGYLLAFSFYEDIYSGVATSIKN